VIEEVSIPGLSGEEQQASADKCPFYFEFRESNFFFFDKATTWADIIS
jgi:hypothetical protein